MSDQLLIAVLVLSVLMLNALVKLLLHFHVRTAPNYSLL